VFLDDFNPTRSEKQAIASFLRSAIADSERLEDYANLFAELVPLIGVGHRCPPGEVPCRACDATDAMTARVESAIARTGKTAAPDLLRERDEARRTVADREASFREVMAAKDALATDNATLRARVAQLEAALREAERVMEKTTRWLDRDACEFVNEGLDVVRAVLAKVQP